MRKITFLLILASLFAFDSFSQTDSSYKNRIDSILMARRFNKVKKIRVAGNGYRVRYFYPESTEQLEMIEVVEIIGEEYWIFNYYFVDNEFVKLNKWNNHVQGDPKRAVANYYFFSNKVVFKEENNTSVSDIDTQLQRVMYLKTSSPK